MRQKVLRDHRAAPFYWLPNESVDEGWIRQVGVYAWAVYTVMVRNLSDGTTMPSVDEISEATGISTRQVKYALKTLRSTGMLDRLEIGGGRDMTPSVYAVNGGPAQQEKPKQKEAPSFDEIWAAYPRRPGMSKIATQKCYNARLKEGHTHEQMLAGVRAYEEYCVKTNTVGNYIKQPTTFLGPSCYFLGDFTVEERPGKEERKSFAKIREQESAESLIDFYEKEEVVV